MMVFSAQLAVGGDAFAHPLSLYLPPPLELHCHSKTIARCSYLYSPISTSPLLSDPLSNLTVYCWNPMRKGGRVDYRKKNGIPYHFTSNDKRLDFCLADQIRQNFSFTIRLSYERDQERPFLFMLTPSNFHPCNMLMSFLKVFYRLFIPMRKRFYLTFFTTLFR